MMVLENHFLSRSIHTAAASEAEQKQAVKMNFHILKDLIYMPAFLAQPNFFSLEALKKPATNTESVPHIKNGYCNCFHGLYP